MPRPFPVMPRGPRRAKPRKEQQLFGCPRVSPRRELAALHGYRRSRVRFMAPSE